jgi:hypothetical protein
MTQPKHPVDQFALRIIEEGHKINLNDLEIMTACAGVIGSALSVIECPGCRRKQAEVRGGLRRRTGKREWETNCRTT